MASDQVVCTVDPAGPVPVLAIAGSLDMSSAVDVATAMDEAVATYPDVLAVDLTRMSVRDDVALTVFPAFSRAAAAWAGCRTMLHAPGEGTRRALERMAITRSVPVYADWDLLQREARALPPPPRYRLLLASHPGAAAAARRLLRTVCGEWDLTRLVGDAEVIVTELVANAVQHAHGDPLLTVVVGPRQLHIGVRDGSATPPRRAAPDPDAGPGGRGLLLVEAVAACWGSTPVDGGKVVWATLRLPDR